MTLTSSANAGADRRRATTARAAVLWVRHVVFIFISMALVICHSPGSRREMSHSGVHMSKFGAVVRVSSGNFLEMYDFMVFGYYASAIGAAFFPSGNPFSSLMFSLMTFGAGFLMRPFGAIVLGAYTDQHGRRAGLLLTLSLMSVVILS